MSDTKQTAVEWLFAQYKKFGVLGIKDFNKALAMEREQIRAAYQQCGEDSGGDYDNYSSASQQYYTDTYGNK